MQEKILTKNICKNILLFSPFIKYVGVIDRYGKLITGLCKNEYIITLINNASYPVIFDKIAPALDYFNAITAYDYHDLFKSNLYSYLLIEKNTQNLIIFPIMNNGDRYFCVFSECNGDISEIIEKLLLVIV